jgi:hypothetical protein
MVDCLLHAHKPRVKYSMPDTILPQMAHHTFQPLRHPFSIYRGVRALPHPHLLLLKVMYFRSMLVSNVSQPLPQVLSRHIITLLKCHQRIQIMQVELAPHMTIPTAIYNLVILVNSSIKRSMPRAWLVQPIICQ